MLSSVILSSLLVVALAYDLLYTRIPNYLILFGLISGFILQITLLGYSGLFYGLQGLLLGFLILFPMYIMGGTGAGDVKLMSVVGLFLGHWQNVFVAGCATLIIGGICALVWIFIRKDALVSLRRYGSMIKCFVITGHVAYIMPNNNETAAQRFPYAIAISSGTYIALYLILNCSHAYKGILA